MAGPLNEYQRRFLDVTQQHLYLKAANAGGPPPEHYGYVKTFGSVTNPLTNGVVFQDTIAIQSDAWFLWQYLQVTVTLPNLLNFGGPEQFTDAGNILLQITLPGMGTELMQVPAGFSGIPAANVAGTPSDNASGIPFIFATPVLLPPNTNVNISVAKLGTNASADNPDPTGCWVVLNGARIPVWS